MRKFEIKEDLTFSKVLKSKRFITLTNSSSLTVNREKSSNEISCINYIISSPDIMCFGGN